MPVFPGSDEEKVLMVIDQLEDAMQLKYEAERRIKKAEYDLIDFLKVANDYGCVRIDWRKLKHRIKSS